METNRTNNRDAGFTIIETMIAICLFSIGILAAVSMQTASVMGNSSSMKFTEASQLATNLAEEIDRMPYDATSQILTDATSPFDSVGSNGETYTTSWDVAPEVTYANGANTFIARELTVTVTWAENHGDKTVTMTFIKAPSF